MIILSYFINFISITYNALWIFIILDVVGYKFKIHTQDTIYGYPFAEVEVKGLTTTLAPSKEPSVTQIGVLSYDLSVDLSNEL